MALSMHHSWEPVEHLNSDDVGLLHETQSEVTDALLGFFSDPFEASHLPIDSLFDPPGDPLYDETNANPLPSSHHPCFSAPSMLSIPPDLYAPSDVEFDLCHRPKRPRSCSDLYQPPDLVFEANFCSLQPVVASSLACCQVPDLLTEFMAPPPPVERKESGGGCLSAQSAAARARRKRISEKTQELGRLIPGGNKLNTAEMFQAAYKYVKFLQAQVGLLDLMGSIKDCKVPQQVEQQLHVLLPSALIQEKLSGEGRCVIPNEVIEAMSKDEDIESNPLISRDLDRFIKSIEQLRRHSND